MLVIHEQMGRRDIGALMDSLRKDAKGFVHEELDWMCDGRDILLDDVNDLIEDTRFVNHAHFLKEESKMIGNFEEAIEGNRLCWIETAIFYKAEGDEISDPTDSGEDELTTTISPCFKFGRFFYEDAGSGELEEKSYNKAPNVPSGIGIRIWTGGGMPTVEQREAAKWEGGVE